MTTEKKMTSKSETHKIHTEFANDRKIVLHHGDSLEFLKTVPDNSINLIVTSPPYNTGKDYEEKVALKTYLKNQEIPRQQVIKLLKQMLLIQSAYFWAPQLLIPCLACL